jgi:hypothetical protein
VRHWLLVGLLGAVFDEAQATAFADEAYSVGFNAHLEPES